MAIQLATTLFFLFMLNLKQVFGAIDLLNLDYDVGVALGVGEFAGGLILTIVLLFAFCSLPIYKKNIQMTTIFSLLIMLFCIAVTWLSIFALIIVIFVIALGIADKLTNIVGGRIWG